MKHWSKFSFLPLAEFLLVFLSCSGSPAYYSRIDEGVNSGRYEYALSLMEDENGQIRENVYTPKNEILYYLDRGMIEHYAGLYSESSRNLETAELLIEAAFTKSISQEIASYLLNDNAKDYSGEDYEDLYINVFNALNYYHSGDNEGALVEIRHLNEKLNYFADKYETAAAKVLESRDDINLGQIQTESSGFSNSALARYLGLLFYRGTGRMDDARVDYEELLRARSLAPEIYSHEIPSSLEEELWVPEGKGRLNIIAFTGLSPVKTAESIFMPLPFAFPNDLARLSLPVMIERPCEARRAEAVLDSGETFGLELIEDMGAVARETFKSRYSLIVLKTAARTIAKAAASAAIARTAYESSDRDSGAGFFAGFLGRLFTIFSEQADTRLSRYFPSKALVGGINLEPGNHTVTVNFYGNSGLLLSETKEVVVRETGVNLEEFICLR